LQGDSIAIHFADLELYFSHYGKFWLDSGSPIIKPNQSAFSTGPSFMPNSKKP
jgi:hypothetical protein